MSPRIADLGDMPDLTAGFARFQPGPQGPADTGPGRVMGIYAIHHRKPAPLTPINTSDDYCRAGCWTPPGREHGLACPAVEHNPPLFFRGFLRAFPIAVALDAILLALLIWSLT
jgi:hypothetical protein